MTLLPHPAAVGSARAPIPVADCEYQAMLIIRNSRPAAAGQHINPSIRPAHCLGLVLLKDSLAQAAAGWLYQLDDGGITSPQLDRPTIIKVTLLLKLWRGDVSALTMKVITSPQLETIIKVAVHHKTKFQS